MKMEHKGVSKRRHIKYRRRTTYEDGTYRTFRNVGT